MIKKYRKLLLAVVVLLFAGLLGWNIYLQRELYKYKPQVEAYLPEDIYVAVGSTIELYNDQVVWSGLRDGYSCNWDCQIGENLEDRFSVTGKEEQVGDYPLTLTVYDYNVNETITLSSTLHVVEQLEGRVFHYEYGGQSVRRKKSGTAPSTICPAIRLPLQEQGAGPVTATREEAVFRRRIIWSRRSFFLTA